MSANVKPVLVTVTTLDGTVHSRRYEAGEMPVASQAAFITFALGDMVALTMAEHLGFCDDGDYFTGAAIDVKDHAANTVTGISWEVTK